MLNKISTLMERDQLQIVILFIIPEELYYLITFRFRIYGIYG